MQKSMTLKPQDVAILIKILARDPKNDWRQLDLAVELSLSQGEIAKALSRLNKAGLINDKRVHRSAALEFIIHALKYVFPAEVGSLAVGTSRILCYE